MCAVGSTAVISCDRSAWKSTGSPGKLAALNANSGTLLWSYSIPYRVDSSPAVANRVVYVGGDDGKVYAFNK